MEDCNTCTCSNGVWACTLMLCIGKKAETENVCIGAGATRQCFPAKRETSCTLGDSKMLDCNSCTCAGYGSSTFWLCTMKFCGSLREVEADSSETCISAGGTMQCFPAKKEQECVGGETKKVGCNTCICAGETWICTEMACLESKELALVERRKTCVQAGNVRKCFERRNNEIVEKCSPGRAYKIDCNLCLCDGGEWLCTLKHCPSSSSSSSNLKALQKRESPPACKNEEVQIKDCNTCVCIDGEWMCTFRMCHKIVKREIEGKVEKEKEERGLCASGEAKRKDCNVCVCVNGEFMCTLRMCSKIVKKEEVAEVAEQKRGTCAQGEVKRKDCNVCICVEGQFMCTLRMCKKIVKKSEKEVAERGVTRECRRGETKMDKCNRCVCLNGDWACTLKYC